MTRDAQLKNPHSAEYFGESRNYWWNADFLELMGRRWNLETVETVLDVGCGLSYWGILLKDILPQNAKVVGIDRENSWIEQAKIRAQHYKIDDRYSYKVGDANQLPFLNHSFDMVTCQTLLIHVADVKGVLLEMVRVLKPGGILVLIEPNNIACSLILSTLDLDENVDDILDAARFQFLCERGKKSLNEGYFSIGDQLPGYLAEIGLNNIQVYISDKARALFPPYNSEEQQSIVNERRNWSKTGFWIWHEENAKRYYVAGGGDITKFDFYWKKILDRYHTKVLKGIDNISYSTSGGILMYCISANKL